MEKGKKSFRANINADSVVISTGSEEYFVAVNATDLQINEQLALTSKALKSANNDHVPMHVAPYSYAARECSWKINGEGLVLMTLVMALILIWSFRVSLRKPRLI